MSAKDTPVAKRRRVGGDEGAGGGFVPSNMRQRTSSSMRRRCMCGSSDCADATDRWHAEHGEARGMPSMMRLAAKVPPEDSFTSPSTLRRTHVQARQEKRLLRRRTLKFFNTTEAEVQEIKDPRWSVPVHLPHWFLSSVDAARGDGERFKLPSAIAMSSLPARGAPRGFLPDPAERVRPNADNSTGTYMLIVPQVKAATGIANVSHTLGTSERDVRHLDRQIDHHGAAFVHEREASASTAMEERLAQLEAKLAAETARADKAEEEKELYRKAGLNRHILCDAEWHNKNPDACKNYFGFPGGWQSMVIWVTCICFASLECSTQALGLLGLSEFEQCIAVRFWMRTGWKMYRVARVWGITKMTFSNYLRVWVPRWGTVGRTFARLTPTLDYIMQCQPAGHIAAYGMAIALLVDGKDSATQTDRASYAIMQLMCSSKIHGDAIRYLWGSMPHGLVVFVTDCFLGRASEKRLVQLHAKWLDLVLPAGTGLQLDRGFFGISQYLKNLNKEFIPSAKDGRARMHPGEVTGSRLEAQNRYTCEVCFARLVHMCAMMGIEIPHAWLVWANDVMLVGAFTANLMKPLNEPASWGERGERLAAMLARCPPLDPVNPLTDGSGLPCDSLIADYVVSDTPARHQRMAAYRARSDFHL